MFPAAVLQTQGQGQGCTFLGFSEHDPEPNTEPFVCTAPVPSAHAWQPEDVVRSRAGIPTHEQGSAQVQGQRGLSFLGLGLFCCSPAQLPQGFQALCCQGNSETTDSPKTFQPRGKFENQTYTAQAELISTQNVEFSVGTAPKAFKERGREKLWTMSSHVCLGWGHCPAWQKGREKRRKKPFWQWHSMVSAVRSA